VWDDGGELISAYPIGAVAQASASEHLRHAVDDFVAIGMAVAVVDELEVVDVEHGQRQRLVVAGRGGYREWEVILEAR
jgi:hypothetical protein